MFIDGTQVGVVSACCCIAHSPVLVAVALQPTCASIFQSTQLTNGPYTDLRSTCDPLLLSASRIDRVHRIRSSTLPEKNPERSCFGFVVASQLVSSHRTSMETPIVTTSVGLQAVIEMEVQELNRGSFIPCPGVRELVHAPVYYSHVHVSATNPT